MNDGARSGPPAASQTATVAGTEKSSTVAIAAWPPVEAAAAPRPRFAKARQMRSWNSPPAALSAANIPSRASTMVGLQTVCFMPSVTRKSAANEAFSIVV